jgi:hypothetical protein
LVEKILEEIPFSSKDSYGGSSLFRSNIPPGMHLRKISQILEPYTQLIPNIPKVVEPLKAYKWRHSHGKIGERKSAKHCYFDRGYFDQGWTRGLGEVVATSSKDCKFLIEVLI